MPPRIFSRYQFTAQLADSQGRAFLTDRERFGFQDLSDNRQHIVSDGESLFTLAARYFAPLPRPAGLWWVIADFQPDPIFDPTLALEPGTVLVIPSLRTVQEDIFAPSRLSEA